MRRFLLICLIIVTSVSAEAQKLFSDDVNVFYGEAVRAIESVGTEAANKVSLILETLGNPNTPPSKRKNTNYSKSNAA